MKLVAIKQVEVRLARIAQDLLELRDQTWRYDLLDSTTLGMNAEDVPYCGVEGDKVGELPDFPEMRAAWERFLIAASGIYSKLELGSKGCSVSEPWFGRISSIRRNDELLQYIHQARNSEEHGLEPSSTNRGLRVYGPGEPQRGDGHYVVGIKASDPPGTVVAQVSAPRLMLVPVVNRGRTYYPPLRHLGQTVQSDDPYEVANLAFSYLSALVNEARLLPIHD